MLNEKELQKDKCSDIIYDTQNNSVCFSNTCIHENDNAHIPGNDLGSWSSSGEGARGGLREEYTGWMQSDLRCFTG